MKDGIIAGSLTIALILFITMMAVSNAAPSNESIFPLPEAPDYEVIIPERRVYHDGSIPMETVRHCKMEALVREDDLVIAHWITECREVEKFR